MSENEAVYRSPSREYLIGLLSAMRDASTAAQRTYIQYQRERARIATQVSERAQAEEWTEEAAQTVLQIEADGSKLLKALAEQYVYHKERATYNGNLLQTEASVYWLLWQEPEQAVDQSVPVAEDEEVPVLRVDHETQIMPAVQ